MESRITVGAIAILAVVSGWLFTVLRKAYFSPLSKIPNAHWSAPLSDFWNLKVHYDYVVNETRVAIHKRLGPIVRIAPNELSIGCVDGGVRTVYGANFDKSDWYTRAFRGDETTPSWLFTMRGKADHRERKKIIAAAYTKSAIWNDNILSDLLVAKLTILLEQISDAAKRQADLDVKLMGKCFMMDATSPWLYGSKTGTNFLKDNKAANDFLVAIQETDSGFWRTHFPFLTKTMERLGIWGSLPPEALMSQDFLQNWCGAMVESGRKEGEKVQSEVSLLSQLSAGLLRDKPSLSHDKLSHLMIMELLDHILASQEVGGSTVAFAMHELSIRPEWQKRLNEELSAARKTKPSLKAFINDSDDYRVLDAVWMETLRFRATGPGPWPRVVPEGGTSIGDYEGIPAGTIVSASAWALHFNEPVFPNPREWRPERWLEANEEKEREMRKWMWGFSSGARVCIGQHFAEKAIKAMFAGIYSEFETSVEDKQELEQIDNWLSPPKADTVPVHFSKLV